MQSGPLCSGSPPIRRRSTIMPTLNALAQRPAVHPVVRAASQDAAAASTAYHASAGQAIGRVPARLPVVDAAPQSASGSNVSLSQQALEQRVSALGAQTIDVAQHFLQSFASTLFGDAAKGARFDFDSVSLSADAGVSAAALHAGDGSSQVDGAALNFSESSSFTGHGQLVTKDGQSYSFDIEVEYRASASATAVTSTQPTQSGQDTPATPEQALVGKQLPPVKYPGSLADLFKLLGRQLDASVSSKDGGDADGQLSMRLIRLVNSAALLAPRLRSDGSPAVETGTPAGSRALAQYGAGAVGAAGAAATPISTATDLTA